MWNARQRRRVSRGLQRLAHRDQHGFASLVQDLRRKLRNEVQGVTLRLGSSSGEEVQREREEFLVSRQKG